MLVKLFVKVMLVNLLQLLNALCPMLVTLLGKMRLVNPVELNASDPMLVTLLGMLTLVKLVQLKNA